MMMMMMMMLVENSKVNVCPSICSIYERHRDSSDMKMISNESTPKGIYMMVLYRL